MTIHSTSQQMPQTPAPGRNTRPILVFGVVIPVIAAVVGVVFGVLCFITPSALCTVGASVAIGVLAVSMAIHLVLRMRQYRN